MVTLDHQLIYAAERLVTGSNVHRVKELIFAYEQAVKLHNRQRRGSEIYRINSEVKLRNYVMEQQGVECKRRTIAAINLAQHAKKRISG